jgi:hypothetical protein
MWNEFSQALQMLEEKVLNIPNGVWSAPGGSAVKTVQDGRYCLEIVMRKQKL